MACSYYTYDCRIKSRRKRHYDNMGHEFIEDVGKFLLNKIAARWPSRAVAQFYFIDK